MPYIYPNLLCFGLFFFSLLSTILISSSCCTDRFLSERHDDVNMLGPRGQASGTSGIQSWIAGAWAQGERWSCQGVQAVATLSAWAETAASSADSWCSSFLGPLWEARTLTWHWRCFWFPPYQELVMNLCSEFSHWQGKQQIKWPSLRSVKEVPCWQVSLC